jgi:hypothetical protein
LSRERDFEDAVSVAGGDVLGFDRPRHAERAMIRALAVPSLVDVLGRDAKATLVPVDVDLLAVEARHLDREDELAVFLVQFDVGVAAPSEQLGRGTESLQPVVGRSGR